MLCGVIQKGISFFTQFKIPSCYFSMLHWVVSSGFKFELFIVPCILIFIIILFTALLFHKNDDPLLYMLDDVKLDTSDVALVKWKQFCWVWLFMLISNWWECYTWMCIVAFGLHLLASLLCHLTALNKIMLIAYERVPDSWSCPWMCMVSVAIHTECAVVSAERPWLTEGCGWKNGLGGKDCETGTQNAGNFSVKSSHFGIMYVYLRCSISKSNIHNKW